MKGTIEIVSIFILCKVIENICFNSTLCNIHHNDYVNKKQ